MDLHSDTTNRSAFELANAATAEIARYTATRDLDSLATAEERLDAAERLDPNYLRVIYLKGIVRDLSGVPVEAIPFLEQALAAARPPLAEEIRYNLAVAYYHRYHAEDVDRAIKLFGQVIADEKTSLSLRLLAQAGLAQAYAMRMIPRRPDEPDRQRIGELFARVGDAQRQALRKLKKIDDEKVVAEVRWMIHNATGMSLMYHSDYFGSREEKIREVTDALEQLMAADRHSPRNWANYCDLGSAHMRLGYWRGGDATELERALAYLQRVVDELRPHYGFALYEIGRLYRINGQFDVALRWFAKSLAIPADRRDVGNRRVDIEVARAKKSDSSYP